MTCVRYGNTIICSNPRGRLRLNDRYVWVDFHTYCGPAFFWDSAMTKVYDPVDENDPIWSIFEKWRDKYKAKERRVVSIRARGRT